MRMRDELFFLLLTKEALFYIFSPSREGSLRLCMAL